MNEIVINLSRKKLILLFLASSGFVFFSIWFILNPERFVFFLAPNEQIIRIIGVVGALCFGIGLIYFPVKMFDSKPGLIINNNGIIDNTNAGSMGMIPWEHIINIEVKKIHSTKLILIFVKNPNDYFQNVSLFKKLNLKRNINNYGTPITLTSVGLKCNFDELNELVNSHWKKHQESNQ